MTMNSLFNFKIDYQTPWLEIFPEAIDIVQKNIKSLDKMSRYFENRKLAYIYDLQKTKTYSVDWFYLKIRLYKISKLIEDWEKTSNHLKRMLPLPKDYKNNRIPDWQIKDAINYPLDQLIEVKRNKAICPFHDDKHPSMSVNGNLYYCFACGAKGNTVGYIMRLQNLSFIDAVKSLLKL